MNFSVAVERMQRQRVFALRVELREFRIQIFKRGLRRFEGVLLRGGKPYVFWGTAAEKREIDPHSPGERKEWAV